MSVDSDTEVAPAESPAEEHVSKVHKLDAILNGESDTYDADGFVDKTEGGWDEEGKGEEEAAQGFCVECEGPSVLLRALHSSRT